MLPPEAFLSRGDKASTIVLLLSPGSIEVGLCPEASGSGSMLIVAGAMRLAVSVKRAESVVPPAVVVVIEEMHDRELAENPAESLSSSSIFSPMLC